MTSPSIEPAIETAISTNKIHGALLCASDAAGAFTYNATLGSRTLLSGEKRPHRLDDVLFLASATKLLATIAALQCVEDGLLSLTGDLSPFAPELTAKQVLTGFSSSTEDDGAETPDLAPPARPITLEMLLTHSSGVTYYFLDPPIARWRASFAPVNEGSKRRVEELFTYPLSFQPGSSWLYGPGIDWAGRIVERATGRTLGEHLHARIFEPLGITDASFYPVTDPALRARLVDLNPDDPDATGRAVLGGDGEMNRQGKGDFGGHGLFMTAEGYARVLRSLLANDGKILRPETVEGMFEDHLSAEASMGLQEAMAGRLGVAFKVADSLGLVPEAKIGHGLGGLLMLEDLEGYYGEGTLSWGGGLTFGWFVDRNRDLCGLCALQAALPVDLEVVAGLKQAFRRDIYRKQEVWRKGKAG